MSDSDMPVKKAPVKKAESPRVNNGEIIIAEALMDNIPGLTKLASEAVAAAVLARLAKNDLYVFKSRHRD